MAFPADITNEGAPHGAPFSLPVAPLPEALPRHPAPRLGPQGRRDLLTWLWRAAVGPLPDPLPLQAPAAWADLPALAEGHGLAALVLHEAERVVDRQGGRGPGGRAEQSAAAEGLARLSDAADRTLRRGGVLAEDLGRLEAAFVRAEVDALWLKGSHLLREGLYRPPAGRPMADLDVFVPPRHWPAAAGCLRALGYRTGARSWKHQLWRGEDHRVVDLRGEHPDNPRPVEVHGVLGEAFRGLSLTLDPAGSSVADARPGRRLLPGAAFLLLAAHSTVSLLERRLRLVQLLDLLRLAARLVQQDWAWIGAHAAGPGRARFVWPSLAIVERLEPGCFPDAPFAAIAQACPLALRRWTIDQPLDSLCWPGSREARRAFLEMPRIWPIGLKEQARFWQTVLLPEPSRLADRYPDLAERGRVDLMFLRHAGFTWSQLRRRWQQRA